jgi:hypothetical protein
VKNLRKSVLDGIFPIYDGSDNDEAESGGKGRAKQDDLG